MNRIETQVLFEIQQNTICDGWVNTWHYTDEYNQDHPMTFKNKESAEFELAWFLTNMIEEYEAGNLSDYPEVSQFRIAEVKLCF